MSGSVAAMAASVIKFSSRNDATPPPTADAGATQRLGAVRLEWRARYTRPMIAAKLSWNDVVQHERIDAHHDRRGQRDRRRRPARAALPASRRRTGRP
jgi:hypothetical protein